ncbi:MAG: type IV pilus modification PilV family protein [Candidatus Rifleibacteriota bacterium]
MKQNNTFNPDKRSGCPYRAGISLIEIMIAFAILVVSAFSISGLISYGHRGTQKDFRNVLSIQLLEQKMNQVLTLSYEKVSDGLLAGNTEITVEDTIFKDTDYEIALGDIKVDKTDYKVTVKFEKIPVSFEVRPFEIDNDYEFDDVTTYKFGAETSELAKFDGSNAQKNRYRTIKVTAKVTWTEPIVEVDREVQAVSMMVDLESTW